MLSSRLWIVATALALPALIGTPAAAQTVFSDDFNSEPEHALNHSAFTNWDVFDGYVDSFAFYPDTHGVSIDLDGTGYDAGRLVTKTAFALAPGTYRLSWDLSKNGDFPETVTVSLGSVFSEVITDELTYVGPVRFERMINVTTATHAAIQFDHAGADNWGFILDNVLLESVGGPALVPEPNSLALVGLAVLPMRLARRRNSGFGKRALRVNRQRGGESWESSGCPI